MALYLNPGVNRNTDPLKATWITSWQAFLAGEGFFSGEYAPYYGKLTNAATRSYQISRELVVSGDVDSRTVKRALSEKFDPPGSWWRQLVANRDALPKNEVIAAATTLSDAPRPPGYMDPAWPRPLDANDDGRADLVYLGEAQRDTLFGPIEYGVGSDKRPVLLNDWKAQHVVTTFIPELKGVPVFGSACSGNVLFHRDVACQLAGAIAEIRERGLLGLIKSYGGTFMFRFIRGSLTTISTHGYAAAIDLNMEWNGLGKQPALVGQMGTLRPLIEIFNRWGFFWGGHYRSRADGMHLEVVRVLPTPEVLVMSAQFANNDSVLAALQLRAA